MNLSLEIAKQTMLQAQAALGVATNNIANSSVEGYTRQRANLVTSMSILSGSSHLVGTGATITSIDRLRSGFYDKQYRENLNIYMNSATKSTALLRLESYFGGVDGDTGLKSSISEVFNSLHELSKNPEKDGIKQVVKDSAYAMIQSFHLVASNINTAKEQYISETNAQVNDINNMLKDLQIVNDEIGRLSALGQQPNDLLDQRDRIIDTLSSKMDITVLPTDNNMVNVISSGHVLVQVGHCSELGFTENTDGTVSIVYEDGTPFKSNGGELSAMVEIINDIIPKYAGELDTFAVEFMDKFNAIYSTGVNPDGTPVGPFFEGTSASDIKINDDIFNDPSLIVTSTDGSVGNNDMILELIGLKESVIEDFDNLVTKVATEAKASMTKTENYKYMKDELYKMRQNEIGVNEDEEILNAVKLQQTFAAASKIISTLDEMFNSLITAV